MNVNPDSSYFGSIVPWDTLTDEQKASGEWIELPDVSGEPRRAVQKHPIESLFSGLPQSVVDHGAALRRGLAREFDATGKTR